MIGKRIDRLSMAQWNSASGVDISYQTAVQVHAHGIEQQKMEKHWKH